MRGFENEAEFVLAAFYIAVALWFGLSALVLLNRLRYDRRTKRLFALANAGDRDYAELEALFTRLDRDEVYRIVADSRLPAWLTGHLATRAVDRWGFDRIRDDALSGRKGRRRIRRRGSALVTLGHVGGPEVYDVLEQVVNGGDAELAAVAVVVLRDVGDERAARILIDALVKQSYSASRIATQLDQFPVSIDDMLRPLLASALPHARYWGVSLLRRYPRAPALSPRITALADDVHPPVRKAVIHTLERVDAVAAFIVARRLLADPVGYVRARAVRAFAARGARGLGPARRATFAREIAPMLADVDWDVRLAAKESLVALGPTIWREVAPLLESPDRFARNGAAEVLQNLDVIDQLIRDDAPEPDELHALEGALREGGPAVLEAAIARVQAAPTPVVARLLQRYGSAG